MFRQMLSPIFIFINVFWLTSSFLCAAEQRPPEAAYDIRTGYFANKRTAEPVIRKLKSIGAPVYSVVRNGEWELIADTNTSHANAVHFVGKYLAGSKAVPVENYLDVAPDNSVAPAGAYPISQLYTYVPGSEENQQDMESGGGDVKTSRRVTVSQIAAMPPNLKKLSARELAGMPANSAADVAGRPPAATDLSARQLARQARNVSPAGKRESAPDDSPDPSVDDLSKFSSGNRNKFIALIGEYIRREHNRGSPGSNLPTLQHKPAAYYAAWIYDAARLYKLDPFLLVAISNHETNFMNVNGDWNHFTNGVRNHSEGMFQMLKTTQREVYEDMKLRGLGRLVAWRPGEDLKQYPRDQAYMAAHFLKFFCLAHPKNYQTALTAYNGSPTYPPKVFEKLHRVKSYYSKQTTS